MPTAAARSYAPQAGLLTLSPIDSSACLAWDVSGLNAASAAFQAASNAACSELSPDRAGGAARSRLPFGPKPSSLGYTYNPANSPRDGTWGPHWAFRLARSAR